MADVTKRAVLHEPVVFADRSELIEVGRHPQPYLPFVASPALIVAAGFGVLAVLCLLVWAERPLWGRSAAVAVSIRKSAEGFEC